MPESPIDYLRANSDQFLESLQDLLRIPSISALPDHREDVCHAAEFVADELRAIGMKSVGLIEGASGQHPLVYGEWLEAPGKPTLLLYGHYDVQPPDPLDEWKSPPFEPTVRGDDLFARGACDDKGQTWILVKAVECLLKGAGWLPVNIKFLIEGEEEVGGEHIEQYIAKHRDRLKADAVLLCDTEMFAPGLPTITTGLRGLIYTEIEARGPAQDLHSGLYGGPAPNPIQALAEILCGLRGRDGKVRIPGFYKDVERPSRKELDAWKRLPFKEKAFLKNEVGSSALSGERNFPVLERMWARPTLEVHGIRGGFVGEGPKAVIPAVATAKVSMRLVPRMKPKEIIKAYTDAVKKLTPKGTETKIRLFHGAPASVVSTENKFVEAAAEAMQKVFKKKTVYMRSGGSIPVVGLFQQQLHIPSIMVGFGLPDDRLHSPNEKFHLPNFYAGIESVIRYLEILGQ